MLKKILFIVCFTCPMLSFGQTQYATDTICDMIANWRTPVRVGRQIWSLEKLGENKFELTVSCDSQTVSTTEIKSLGDSCFNDGFVTIFFSDSSRLVTPCKNGVENGTEKLFYPNGNLKIRTDYKDGIESGYFLEYYESGTLKENGRFNNGCKDGEWITYYPTYTLNTTGSYFPTYSEVKINNNADSLIFFNVEGKVVSKMHWADGLDSLMEYFHIDDYSGLAFPLKLYTKDGAWIYYNEEGNLIMKEYYKKGTLLRKEE